MAGNRERRLRREPRTEESEAIVAAIVEAAGELLVADGLDKTNTNRVAERAGVSVGSVYRYFPDKEAIITEVGRRHRLRNAERAIRAIRAPGDFPTVIRSVLETFVALEGYDAELRRILSSEVPPAWLRTAADEVWAATEQAIAAELRSRVPSLSDAEAQRRSFVAMHAVEGVARDATLRLTPEERAEVLDELAAMLLPYLSRR